jgi:ATP-dependent Clp protease protease subunit
MSIILEHNIFKKPLESVPMAYLQLETMVDSVYRNIYWDDSITDMLPFFMKQRINLIAQQTDDETTPINFYLNSQGGDVYAAMGVVDVIKTAKMPINIIGCGNIMSAAVFILIAATGKKTAYKSTRFMLHTIWGGTQGKLSEVEITAVEMKTMQNKIFELLVEHTKQPDIKFWRKFGEKADKYFDTNSALELGIIDELQEC